MYIQRPYFLNKTNLVHLYLIAIVDMGFQFLQYKYLSAFAYKR